MRNKKNSDFSDFKYFESFSGCEYDGDKQILLYSTNRYIENLNRKKSLIFLKDLSNGNEIQITANGEGENSASFSPDKRKILFLSSGPWGRQLFIYDIESKSVAQATTMKNGLLDPRWSEDGKKILFASSADDNISDDFYKTFENSNNIIVDEPIVIEDFGYKFDGAGFQKPDFLHLWILDLEKNKVSKITDGAFNYLHHTWSFDNKYVLCTSNRFRSKKDSIASDLVLIDIDNKENIVQLTKENWTVSYPNPVRPVFTPDKKYIIMGFLDERTKNEKRQSEGYPPAFLHRISVDGKEDIKLMDESEECFDGVGFAYNANCGTGLDKVKISSCGQYAYFLSGHNGANKLFRVSINSKNGVVETIIGGKVAINGLGEAKNGKLLFSMSKTDIPEAYYLLDEKTFEYELLLSSNINYTKEKSIEKTNDFFFETLDGESKVHGFALPPQNREDGKKYPCILYIHGGPHPFYTYGFDLELHSFSGNGIGVLYCNPRGSSGYGTVHRNLERSTDGTAFIDLLQFVDEACRKYDWIDKDRLGVTGGSYGGYMTTYIATHSKKFKAYISQRGVYSDLIGYASSDMQGDSSKFKNFEEFMIDSLKNSNVSYVERINAPFLILHGEDDFRTPVEGAHQMFVALKDLHKDLPVKMVLYPNVGHSQPRDTQNLMHYYNEMLQWFLKYL